MRATTCGFLFEICCYNTKSNDPYKESHHPGYTPLEKVEDARVLEAGRDDARRSGVEFANLVADDIEVVDITPHPVERVPILLAAIEPGKHVLSQKPFVLDLGEGEELAEQKGVRLAVNQNGRWAPHFCHDRGRHQGHAALARPRPQRPTHNGGVS